MLLYRAKLLLVAAVQLCQAPTGPLSKEVLSSISTANSEVASEGLQEERTTKRASAEESRAPHQYIAAAGVQMLW